MGDRIYEGKSPHADHVWAALATIEARRGNLDTQLEYARESARASSAAYAPTHIFWRAGDSVLGNTLLEQAEHFLDRAWETKSDGSIADGYRQRANALLSELKETPNLEWYRDSHKAWIETLVEIGSGGEAGEAAPLLRAARAKACKNKSRLKEIEKWLSRTEH